LKLNVYVHCIACYVYIVPRWLLPVFPLAECHEFTYLVLTCHNTSKEAYIRSLLLNPAVMFLQEHWLSENQLQLLDNIAVCFLCTGVSGFDNSDVLRGGHTAAVRFSEDQMFFLQLTLYL